MYRDLENDILINGQLGNTFRIRNGVKQGDALSCSLFLLAIEPLIRNIENNDQINKVRCTRLNYTWPKALAYADDVSVVTTNDDTSIKEIFNEYWKLSTASGLLLNADKTEMFNIHNEQVAGTDVHEVTYGLDSYRVAKMDTIKLNGIYFSNDNEHMADMNADNMITKMDRHFAEWSKRSLSILGKAQIIKTFGISQFLYSLAVVDLLPKHWKVINKLIAKFIWNKNYAGNRAPNRIKNDIIYNTVLQGGFGMIKLEEVVNCIRIRRFATLEETQSHPVAVLQRRLGSQLHLRSTSLIDIDPTTSSAMQTITNYNKLSYQRYDIDMLETDMLCQSKLCTIKIINIIAKKQT